MTVQNNSMALSLGGSQTGAGWDRQTASEGRQEGHEAA